MPRKPGKNLPGVEKTWELKGEDYTRYVLCQHCGESIRNIRQVVEKHYESHLELRFKCTDCGKLFARQSKLDEHARAVHVLIPCDQCGASIKLSRLDMHVHNHHTPEEKKRYRCECQPDCTKNCKLHCNPVKGFWTQAQLQDHLNMHLGIKPHKCDMGCSDVSFANSANLAAHIRSFHKGIKRKKT